MPLRVYTTDIGSNGKLIQFQTESGNPEKVQLADAATLALELATLGTVSLTSFAPTGAGVLSALPAGNWFILDMWASGCTGASGGRNIAGQVAAGGSGSGGAAHRREIFSRAELAIMLAAAGGSIPVFTPPAQTGPAGRSTSGNGTNALPGVAAQFGPFLVFPGGIGIINQNGAQSAGGGGGTMGPGAPGDLTNSVKAGGPPGPSQAWLAAASVADIALDGSGGNGGTGGGSTSIAEQERGGGAEDGGGGGGVGSSGVSNVPAGPGGNSVRGGGGSAGGGGVTTGEVAVAAAAGGGWPSSAGTRTGNGGAAGTSGTTGGPGGNGLPQRNLEEGGQGGGGGGPGTNGNGGDGGNGGFPGGSGGGGGASKNGTSGKAGDSGAGAVVLRGFM